MKGVAEEMATKHVQCTSEWQCTRLDEKYQATHLEIVTWESVVAPVLKQNPHDLCSLAKQAPNISSTFHHLSKNGELCNLEYKEIFQLSWLDTKPV